MGVRWGILGTGGIAGTFAEALSRRSDGSLVAVASRTLDRASEFARNYVGTVPYGSYEALVSSGDVDVVYIATPQHRHLEDALLVLTSGKHALIEKPMVLDHASATRVAEAAQTHSLIAIEGMWTLFNPLVVRALSEVASGRLGSLRMFSANTGPIGVPAGHRALNADLGGSLLFECLVYPVALLTAMAPEFANPRTVQAVSLVTGADFDFATAALLTSGDAMAEFSGAFAAGSSGAASSRVRALFDNGWLELSDIYNPERLVIGWSDGRLEEHEADAGTVGFGWEIDAVERAVRGEAPLPERVTLPQTMKNIALLEQIQRAASKLGSPD